MSKIDDLISELCPDGVEYKAMGELGNHLPIVMNLMCGFTSTRECSTEHRDPTDDNLATDEFGRHIA